MHSVTDDNRKTPLKLPPQKPLQKPKHNPLPDVKKEEKQNSKPPPPRPKFIPKPEAEKRPEVAKRPNVDQRPEVVQPSDVKHRLEAAQRPEVAQLPKVAQQPPKVVHRPKVAHNHVKLPPSVPSTKASPEMHIQTSSYTKQKEGNVYLAIKPKTSSSMGSIRSSSGLIMIINSLLILMALLLAIAWRSKVTQNHKRYYEDLDDLSLYFIGSLLLPLFVYMMIYIKQLFDCEVHIPSWVAASIMTGLCLLFSILIFASSSFLLKEIHKEKLCIEQRQCMHLTGTTIMGIIIGIGVFAQSFCHFTERKVASSF